MATAPSEYESPPADLLPVHRKATGVYRPARIILLPEGHTVDSLVEEGHRRLQALLPAYHEPRGPKLLRHWLTNLL